VSWPAERLPSAAGQNTNAAIPNRSPNRVAVVTSTRTSSYLFRAQRLLAMPTPREIMNVARHTFEAQREASSSLRPGCHHGLGAGWRNRRSEIRNGLAGRGTEIETSRGVRDANLWCRRAA
jgi:hypothetical protein